MSPGDDQPPPGKPARWLGVSPGGYSAELPVRLGAGSETRTRASSLEDWYAAITSRPHKMVREGGFQPPFSRFQAEWIKQAFPLPVFCKARGAASCDPAIPPVAIGDR